MSPKPVESADRLIIGCGYLGLRVAKQWLAGGLTVAAMTRSDIRAELLRQVGITPIRADVTEAESLHALPTANVVLYAVGFDRAAGRSKREVYVDGLRNVLDVMQTRASRFIYVSSTSVYGQQHGEPVDESSACIPTSEGGQICLEAENLVRSRSGDVASLLEANILRLAGIYGPERLLRRVEQLSAGEPISGSADAYLNLIHVDDAVSAVLACSERWTSDCTYLVSDGNETTRGDYFRTLAEVLGLRPPTFDDSAIARHSQGQNKRCVNHRMLDALGIRLKFGDVRTGLENAVAHLNR